MKRIQLGGHWRKPIKGYTLIDDEDFEWLNKYKWNVNKNGYVKRGIWGVPKKILMHREILGAKKGEQCDHIDGDILDNRKKNLRICTAAENSKNKKKFKNNTSGYKGVSWDKVEKRWRVSIQNNNKQIFVGHFDDIILAAHAYDEVAKKYHGKFARFNFRNGRCTKKIKDQLSKKRKRGNLNITLTKNKVKKIRFLYSTGRYSQYRIAKKLSTSSGAVWRVVNRTTWKNI